MRKQKSEVVTKKKSKTTSNHTLDVQRFQYDRVNFWKFIRYC